MPRENRKRGKKHKKQSVPEEENTLASESHPKYLDEQPEQDAGPSWIVHNKEEQGNSDAPFGYVDPDVKAYFKTVDNKLREWQETKDTVDVDEGEENDPNEERRMFLVAALTELSGKEKQLATDPECSNTLERMAYSMDDFVKRVFFDRLAGSYEQILKHRFGSHVIQTLLTVAKGTICREAKGILPLASDSEEDQGRLPTLTQLVLSLCEEILPSISTLVLDPFASHVLRALFLLLCPSLPAAEQASSILRSKKSSKYRAKQGPMKSVFSDQTEDAEGDAKGKGTPTKVPYPPEFGEMATRIIDKVRDVLSANEVRALAADKSACPVLALLLEMESSQGRANESGSLMDSVSSGLISACLHDPPETPEPSDYVSTLLREPTSSHLLETVVSLVPENAFNVMWQLYFEGKLSRLASHPVANFVVARAIARMNADQLRGCLEELKGSWTKIIKSSRSGVLKAAIDRAAEIKGAESEVCKVVESTFLVDTAEKRKSLVWCALYLNTYDEYMQVLKAGERIPENGEEAPKKKGKTRVALEPSIQGSVLLQSFLRLSEPHNQLVVESVLSQPVQSFLTLAHHPVGSRILDAFLSSPTVPARSKRKLIMAFLEHYHELVADRIGSRVGDRLWAAADPYLKEKIARSLIPYEQQMQGMQYGKFFVRGLNLFLLKRNADEWKAQQVKGGKTDKSASSVSKPGTGTDQSRQPIAVVGSEARLAESTLKTHRDRKKRKRADDKPEDEIDALFSAALGKKQKKGSLGSTVEERPKLMEADSDKPKTKSLSGDRDLDNILGAIRTAPKEKKGAKKKR